MGFLAKGHSLEAIFVHAVENIGHVLAAPIALGSACELRTIGQAASIVWDQSRVPLRGEELAPIRGTDLIIIHLAGIGAMQMRDHRVTCAGFVPMRKDQHARNLPAVARFPADLLTFTVIQAFELRIQVCDLMISLLPVDNPDIRRLIIPCQN